MKRLLPLLFLLIFTLPCWAIDTYNIQRPVISSGVATCNFLIAPYCRISVTQAITTLNLVFPADATPYTLEFDQDNVGHTVTIPATVLNNAGSPIGSPNTAANSVTIWTPLMFISLTGKYISGSLTAASGTYPSGVTPQLTGYDSSNNPEAETISGDLIFTRTGANAYNAAVTKTAGTAFGALATLGVGTGLVSSGGNLNFAIPVVTANGGTGVVSPTTHGVLFGEGGSPIVSLTMAADTVLQGTGPGSNPQAGALLSCSAAGNALTYNTSTHVFGCNTIAGSGTVQSGTGPAIAQYPAGTGTVVGPATISGDATIAAGGALTVTSTNGTAFGSLATLGAGTGLTSSGGNLNLTTPVSATNGGSGVSAPSAGKVLIGEGVSAFGQIAMAADTVLQGTGAGVNPQAAALLSCSASSSALTYNTGTHAFGCNTISGSGTVNTGVQGQFAVYNGVSTAVVSPSGGIRQACSFSGATADLQINNAIAALPNGGIIDARCYGFTSQTIASEVLLTNAIPYALLIDRATTFNCTINNAAKACFHIQGQGSIEGQGEAGAAGGFGITLANGASVLAEVYLDNTVGANAALKNIALNGNSSATVAKGLLYVNEGANLVRVTGVQATGGGSPLIFNLVDITGPMILDNDYPDCGSIGTACTPLRISNDNGGVGTNQVTILNGVYAHEGSGAPNAEIDIADAGGNNTGVIIDGPTLESAHSTAIGINAVRCASCVFRAVGCSAAGANGTSCIKISGVSNNDTVENETMYNAWTNTLVNTAQSNSVTITQANTPAILYNGWQGFTTNGMYELIASNNSQLLFDNGGLVTNSAPMIVSPQALSAFGTCNAAHEGGMATENNSTAACSAGATATSAGTTHCQIYCNGTNWIQTGR